MDRSIVEFEKLVEAFAFHVQAQTQEIFKGSARNGNKHAKKIVETFLKLCAHGNAGRDALTSLFQRPDVDVRTSAASFLLRYRTEEARAILEEAAKGKGLVAFASSKALKRWDEGTWALDLVPGHEKDSSGK